MSPFGPLLVPVGLFGDIHPPAMGNSVANLRQTPSFEISVRLPWSTSNDPCPNPMDVYANITAITALEEVFMACEVA
jgi:hypothetical protein